MVGPPACLHVLIYAHSPGCPAVGHPWRLLDFALEATPLHVAITDRLKPLRNERVSSLFSQHLEASQRCTKKNISSRLSHVKLSLEDIELILEFFLEYLLLINFKIF